MGRRSHACLSCLYYCSITLVSKMKPCISKLYVYLYVVGYLVDSASTVQYCRSNTLVSKMKPCMSKLFVCTLLAIWLILPVQLLLLFLTFSALVANPKKTTLHGGQSRSWSAEQGKKEKKRKSLAAPPPPPPPPALLVRRKKKKKIMRRIHMSRRYASRCYAGGLGLSRVRTRIPTTRRLGQWVPLRKILRFRVRLQLSQSRWLSLSLAMPGRVFLFFPPRGHEPPPTLRDRLNPNLSL